MKRISILVLILCACFVSVAWGQQAVNTGHNWSQFHRPNMRRWNPYETVLNVDNVGNLHQKWSFTTDGAQTVWSSPAVADGVVYVGSEDNNLYALKASTGVKLWSYTTGDNVDSSPAVANEVVYVGSDDWQRVRAECQHRRLSCGDYATGGYGGLLARRGEWCGVRRARDD